MKGTIRLKRSLDADGNWQTISAYLIDGKEVTESEWDAVFPPAPEGVGEFSTISPSCWPMKATMNFAVLPEQVAEANTRNRALGLSSHYERDGTCVIPTPAERRKLMKANGQIDRSGYS